MRHISQESFAGDISFCFVFVGWFFLLNCTAMSTSSTASLSRPPIDTGKRKWRRQCAKRLAASGSATGWRGRIAGVAEPDGRHFQIQLDDHMSRVTHQ